MHQPLKTQVITLISWTKATIKKLLKKVKPGKKVTYQVKYSKKSVKKSFKVKKQVSYPLKYSLNVCTDMCNDNCIYQSQYGVNSSNYRCNANLTNNGKYSCLSICKCIRRLTTTQKSYDQFRNANCNQHYCINDLFPPLTS